MATGGGGDESGEPGGGRSVGGGAGGGGGGSYAQIAGGGQSRRRKKMNILVITLEKSREEINFNLNKTELSKLLFKKMKIEPKDILKTDTSGFKKILIELTSSIDPENFVNLPSFQIREGLRTKLYRPLHRKYTLVSGYCELAGS